MKERTYKYGKSLITIKFGDIASSKDQVIVSSDDYYLTMGGGVSAAILRAGGNEIAIDASKKAPAKLGDVVITTAGRMKAKFIFHAITIGGYIKEEKNPKEIVEGTTKKCLELMSALNLKTISFPAIGAGVAGFTYDDVAVELSQTISNYLKLRKKDFHITIYLFERYGQMKPEDFLIFFESFAIKVPEFQELEEDEVENIKSISKNIQNLVLDTEEEIKSKRIFNLRSHLSKIEDQRFKLEEDYIKSISGIESLNIKEIKEIKAKLSENEEYRLKLLHELNTIKENSNKDLTKPEKATSIFVSSTSRDLVEHRKRIMEQISRLELKFVGMEHFGADPHNVPAIKIREEVKKSDIYIGIFGMRYGFIDKATGMSMTEIEYKEAQTQKKRKTCF